MKQLSIENDLRDVVSRLITQVELATKQGRTDINLALEDAFIPILKSVYNLPNLVNLNRKQKNYPGIDLGDDHDRVSFQITATTSLEKVKQTLKIFIENQYYNSFDELFVLTLTKKQSSYSQTAIGKIIDGKFKFNAKTHIIDLGDILALVTKLRIPTQERILKEFQIILGEVDAYLSFNESSAPQSLQLTSNLMQINVPQTVYVADLVLDEKEVLKQARLNLNFKRRTCSKKSIVKMALLLEGEETDAWVCYESKLFSFLDIENTQLKNIVDTGTLESLNAADFLDPDNINIFKHLLFAHTQERLKEQDIKLHPLDRFFYFLPSGEGTIRKEEWTGKKKTARRVYEKVMSKKDPTKLAHHKHLSFDLSFMRISEQWYAHVIPSWYYSYDGFKRSNWHDNLLSQQKKLEFNQTVRNLVRFIAFFLKGITPVSTNDIHFDSLMVFSSEDSTSEEQPEKNKNMADEYAA